MAGSSEATASLGLLAAVLLALLFSWLEPLWEAVVENVLPLLFLILLPLAALGWNIMGGEGNGGGSGVSGAGGTGHSGGRGGGGRSGAQLLQRGQGQAQGQGQLRQRRGSRQELLPSQQQPGSGASSAPDCTGSSGGGGGPRALVPADDTSRALAESEWVQLPHKPDLVCVDLPYHAVPCNALQCPTHLLCTPQRASALHSPSSPLALPAHLPGFPPQLAGSPLLAFPLAWRPAAATTLSCPKPLGCGFRHTCPDTGRSWMHCDKHRHHAAPPPGMCAWAGRPLLLACRWPALGGWVVIRRVLGGIDAGEADAVYAVYASLGAK